MRKVASSDYRSVLERVLVDHAPAIPYERHTWGPAEQECLIADEHHWHDPVPEVGADGVVATGVTVTGVAWISSEGR